MKRCFLKSYSILFALLMILASCHKERPELTSTSGLPEIRSEILLPFFACNAPIYNFSASGKYSLAIATGFSYSKFGIPGVGTLNFKTIDKVVFEFSGKYADSKNQHKLYNIRRLQDSKYLTIGLGDGMLHYNTRFTGNDALEAYQQYLINNLGNNKYNVIAYKLNQCSWVNSWQDNGVYKIASLTTEYSDPLPSPSKIIYIISEPVL